MRVCVCGRARAENPSRLPRGLLLTASMDAKSFAEQVQEFLETQHIEKEKRETLAEQFIQNDITHPVFLSLSPTTLEELLLTQLQVARYCLLRTAHSIP